MNTWTALVVGLLIGWGVELLIDFLYWRKRRVAPNDKAMAALRQAHDNRLAILEKQLLSCQEHGQQLETEVSSLTEAVSAREAEIARLEAERATLASEGVESDAAAELAQLRAQLEACQASLAEAHAIAGHSVANGGGLGMIWGLTSAASEQLAGNGIYTYSQLAAATLDQVSEATATSATYYSDLDGPGIYDSWVDQAQYAANGDWNGLAAYQARFNPHSMKDNLKKIWGIGPKIEALLNEHGIYLYAQIAAIPASRITDILREAGPRFRMSAGKLHATWPEQARLAERGDWEGLAQATANLDWSQLRD